MEQRVFGSKGAPSLIAVAEFGSARSHPGQQPGKSHAKSSRNGAQIRNRDVSSAQFQFRYETARNTGLLRKLNLSQVAFLAQYTDSPSELEEPGIARHRGMVACPINKTNPVYGTLLPVLQFSLPRHPP